MEANQVKRMSSIDKKKQPVLTEYCNICRGEFDVIEFKDHCICEECVAYIKAHF